MKNENIISIKTCPRCGKIYHGYQPFQEPVPKQLYAAIAEYERLLKA